MGEVSKRFFRAVFATDLDRALDPVDSPEGRFHYASQPALYLSETVNGVMTAMATYLHPDDPARVIVPLHVSCGTWIDARRSEDLRALGFDPQAASVRWQDDRAAGRRPISWDLSDRARATGVDGMFYASRKRPDLSHLVLFRWNTPGATQVAPAGDPLAFPG